MKIPKTELVQLATFVLISSLFPVLGIISYLALRNYLNLPPDLLGQFGDFVGGTLNPLISSIALFGIYSTLTSERSRKAEHIQTIQMSNALALLQLFVSCCEPLRRNDNSDSATRRSILLNLDHLDKKQLLALHSTIYSRWGGVAKILGAIADNTTATRHNSTIVASAIAFLNNTELELLLISLLDPIQPKSELALQLAFSEQHRLTVGFKDYLSKLHEKLTKD